MTEFFQNLDVIENKYVIQFPTAKEKKARGEKMKDSLAMLLKTNGGKMSDYGSLAILMKLKDLKSPSRDVVDNYIGY
jgi:hypothetical protein